MINENCKGTRFLSEKVKISGTIKPKERVETGDHIRCESDFLYNVWELM